MAGNATKPESAPPGTVDPLPLVRYIEELLLELAQLASQAGESGLAASLAIAAIQAGATADRQASTPPGSG